MSKFRNMKFRTKLAVGAALTAAVITGGGAALAYYTSTGSGNGSAAAGNTESNTWGVAQTSTSGGPMYPGQVSTDVTDTFTITNNGTGDQGLNSVTASVATDLTGTSCPGVSCSNPNYGDAEATYNTPASDIVGCLGSWFTATAGTPSPAVHTTISHAGTATDNVTVHFNSAAADQTSCAGNSPAIHLAVT